MQAGLLHYTQSTCVGFANYPNAFDQGCNFVWNFGGLRSPPITGKHDYWGGGVLAGYDLLGGGIHPPPSTLIYTHAFDVDNFRLIGE